MAQSAEVGSMDSWEKLLFLFLGWLLATLSPIIADAIRRRRESKEVKGALLTELRELKYRMACAGYYVQMCFGKIDRKFLEWLRPIVSAYSGPNPSDGISKAIDLQLSLADEALSALSQADRNAGKGGLTLKKYSVPLLDARLGVLTWLPNNVQVLLLETLMLPLVSLLVALPPRNGVDEIRVAGCC
jgi:hypothetical protein